MTRLTARRASVVAAVMQSAAVSRVKCTCGHFAGNHKPMRLKAGPNLFGCQLCLCDGFKAAPVPKCGSAAR